MASDEQQSVDIHVFQSERELVQHNKSLSTFTLNGIAPAARGVPKIETKNQADVLCYQTKKKLEQLSPKITKDEKTKLEFLLKDLKDVKKRKILLT